MEGKGDIEPKSYTKQHPCRIVQLMDLPGVPTLNVFLGPGETGRLIREGVWSPMLPTDPTQHKRAN